MKSALLSKIAMCVCPPAIVATSAVTVPPIKRAVHRLTAPAHAPAPAKPRRVFSAAYDCTPTAVPLSNAVPMGMAVVAPTDAVPSGTPTAFNVRPAQTGFTPVGLTTGPFVGPLLTGGNTNIITPPPVTPSVLPEVSTWAMTITGFGAIGWAMRRRPRSTEAAVEVA